MQMMCLCIRDASISEASMMAVHTKSACFHTLDLALDSSTPVISHW